MNGGDDLLGVQFLLSLVDQDTAAAVRRRIDLDAPEEMTERRTGLTLRQFQVPRSARLWMLEQDDPRTNALVHHYLHFADALTLDMLRGVPFGSATGPLPVLCGVSWCAHRPPELPANPDGMIGGLRKARTMGAARRAVLSVSRRDWPQVAEADRAEPLPGFARWALSVRIDCPPEVRAQFGSHPKFTNRVRRAGIVELPDYVAGHGPAWSVLGVLQLGTRLFPDRAREAATLLAPLVETELGADLEAWAVLAQLAPTFTGTVAELLRTSGAIVRV